MLFPLGDKKKTEVRELAKKFGLPTASKKDSQGICMLGDLNLKDFLSHYIPAVRGDVLNEEGEVIGHHDGAVFLTLGERHGFTITKKTPNDGRYYIAGRDIEKNTISVSHRSDLGENTGPTCGKKEHTLSRISWVSASPEKGKKYEAQIRYHGEYLPCFFDGEKVIFETEVLIAPGQSVVIYDGDACLGGGIIA